jgi:hypothetical protein
MMDRKTNTPVNPESPADHQAAERKFMDHAQQMLTDSRFAIDTVSGKRSVKGFQTIVRRDDRAVELLRLMSELDRPDRQLQQQMPVGQRVEATYWVRRWLVWHRVTARVRVICTSPSRALVTGAAVSPVGAAGVQRLLAEQPPPLGREPLTVVLVSTSGFAQDTHELARRTAGRTLILAEPNAAGGWTIHGPPEAAEICDLLDPEGQEFKSRRISAMIDAQAFDLAAGGVAADKLAAAAAMPLATVEAELRAYARRQPGLAAKRLDGRLVLFREGIAPARQPAASGGDSMPLIDRIKALFARKGETEKKIAFLSERRAALSQQRDRSYEEIAQFEQKDQDLREQFKTATAPLTKRRITGQIVQLRKDVDRRQQMIGVLNQQVNVVSTHLHNLELVRQGKIAELPNSEQIADDAAAAEEMLAELEAQSEVAMSVSGPSSPITAGMTAEEAALFAELEAEAGGGAKAASSATPIVDASDVEQKSAAPAKARAVKPPPLPAKAPPSKDRSDRSQAEPG